MALNGPGYTFELRKLKLASDTITTAYNQAMSSESDRWSIPELEVRMELLTKNWDTFYNAEILFKEQFADNEEAIEQCEPISKMALDNYAAAKAYCKQRIYELKDSQKPKPLRKFADIKLDKFNGDFKNWIAWKAQFLAKVYDTALPIDQKIDLLSGAIIESATDCVGPILNRDNEELERIWGLLQQRYDNEYRLVLCHISQIINFPKLEKESATELQKLVDTINQQLSLLQKFNYNTDGWSPMIVTMLLNKLDDHTYSKWEMDNEHKLMPRLSELFNFIERRIGALNNLKESHISKFNTEQKSSEKREKYPSSYHHKNRSTPYSNNFHLNKSHRYYQDNRTDNNYNRNYRYNQHLITKDMDKKTNGGKALEFDKQKCPYLQCGKTHKLWNCNEFAKLSFDKQIKLIEEWKLCPLCLIDKHPAQECNRTGCLNCNNAKHNSFICPIRRRNKQQQNPSYNGVKLGKRKHLSEQQLQYEGALSPVDCVSKIKKVNTVIDPALQSLNNTSTLLGTAQIRLRINKSAITGPIDFLIGAGIWAAIINDKIIREVNDNKVIIAQQTSIGWVIFGQMESTELSQYKSFNFNLTNANENMDLIKEIQHFWEVENISKQNQSSINESRAERVFKETHTRDANGRYIVTIPIKENPPALGETRRKAVACFHGMERSSKRHPELYKKYRAFIDDYRMKGHLIPVENMKVTNENSYYIPHHAINAVPDKSGKLGKFRVVFNASSKTSTGFSFNDQQLKGPKLQDNLLEIFLRFRTHRFALAADIIQMYRQIKVSPPQWNWQRIIWRDDPSQELQEYAITVVAWGMTSAGFNAVSALKQCAIDEREKFPVGADTVLNDFYFDDMQTGDDDQNSLYTRYNEVNKLLLKGGFPLTKWATNCENLAKIIQTEEQRDIQITNETGVLGMCWNLKTDELLFKIPDMNQIQYIKRLTKRIILSWIVKIFDPSGLIAPVILNGKLMMQAMCKCKVGWDEEVAKELKDKFGNYMENIKALNNIRIPRWVLTASDRDIELHVFTDASALAYGAQAYFRVTDINGIISTSLWTAKSRLAPIKKLTTPRLELLGAAMGAELVNYIRSMSKLNFSAIYLWTDSSIVYYWIHKDVNLLKCFVANRVSKIIELTSKSSWNHVKGRDNPADILSLGTSTMKLAKSKLWWNGPIWLSLPKEQWPKSSIVKLSKEEIQADIDESIGKQVGIIGLSNVIGLDIRKADGNYQAVIERRSTLYSSLRVTAFVFRFIRNTRNKIINRGNVRRDSNSRIDRKYIPAIDATEIKTALRFWVKVEQNKFFKDELRLLKKGKGLKKKSTIIALTPFVDDQQLLRVGGRLSKSELPNETKHQLILPKKCRLTMLLIRNAHLKTLHGGPQIMIALLRQSFWIPQIRQCIKTFNHRCVTCARYDQKAQHQIMGQLPSARVLPSETFLRTGVDFAGPFKITRLPGRQKSARKSSEDGQLKAWIVLFVCLTTRAIHLDVIVGLTIEEFMDAFGRFVARKGRCIELWSDNGTTFVGTNNELKEVLKEWSETLPANQLSRFGTNWKFITPGAPHEGGLWEAGVKSAKKHLRKTIGSRKLSRCELYSVVVQIEGILNSRPLWPMSDDPSDQLPVTPAQLILGKPILQQPLVGDLLDESENRLTLWGRKQKMVQYFWKRWQEEYLVGLQEKMKWYEPKRNLKIGDMVVIRDEKTPPTAWSLGRIIDVFYGSDGFVRSALIKTNGTELERPFHKLCVLPLPETYPES